VCNDLELVKLAYWNWDLVNCKFEDFLTLGLNQVVWNVKDVSICESFEIKQISGLV
jgi:hypothetical protein